MGVTLVAERKIQRGPLTSRRVGKTSRLEPLSKIDAAHTPLRAHRLGHVPGQQPRPGADIQGPLAGPERQRLEHRAALGRHVRAQVDLLDPPGGRRVELQSPRSWPLASDAKPLTP